METLWIAGLQTAGKLLLFQPKDYFVLNCNTKEFTFTCATCTKKLVFYTRIYHEMVS